MKISGHIATLRKARHAGASLGRIMFGVLLVASLTPTHSEAREVRVGIYENHPKVFTGNDGAASGIFVDILNTIASKEDWHITYVPCEWKACLNQLENGDIDLMPDVAHSTVRDSVFDFHDTPALYSWSQIYRRLDQKLESTFELADKRIAVLQGSIQEQEFNTLIHKFGLKVEVIPAPTIEAAFDLAQTGKADAAIASHYYGRANAIEHDLEETPIVFQPVHIYFATAKGRNADLLRALETHLAQWQKDKDSDYFNILKKWNKLESAYFISPMIKEVLLFLIVLLLLSGIVAFVLRQRLKTKTAYLVSAELDLARLTKLYSALRECNQVILRCNNDAEMYPLICRDVVQFGGMKMAWIGQLDEPTRRVIPLSAFGTGVEYLDGMEISIDTSGPKGLGPTGTAVRENRPYWCQDFQHAPETSAWHERGTQFGWGSSASLPLLRKGVVIGAFTLYADHVNAFDEAARNLLTVMAMDISYALDRFADEAQRKQDEATLAESESRFREIFNSVSDAVFIHDADTGEILDVNQRMCEMYGMTHEQALVCGPDDLSEGVAPYATEEAVEKIKAASSGTPQTFEWHSRANDGQLFWTEVTLRFALIGNRRCILAMVHDITHRKLGDMALAASKHLLESVIDTIPMRIFWKDRDGRYLGCNSRFAGDAGEKIPLNIIGKDDYQLGWRAQADLYRADDKRVVESGIAKLSFDAPQSTSDGSTIWLRTSKVPLRGEDNEIMGVLGIYDDITNLRNAEQELYESAQLLKESQYIANLGGYQLDFHTGIWTSSEVLDRLFGIDDSYERSMDGWESLIHPDDRQMMLNFLKDEVIGQRKPFDKEYRIIRFDDQTERWVHGLGKLELDSDGVLLKMRGTVQDITTRKQTDASLLKLSLAVAQSPNTIVITDLDARIEYANETFTKVTGYTLEEVVGQNPRMLQSGRTSKDVYADMWAHLVRGEVWRGELINRKKDGSEYIESALISPVRQVDGRITNYLAIKENITDKRRDEKRLLQLANFDQLTGLPNRALLNERFSYAFSLAQRSRDNLAVMFLDLDHFKNINDTLGHSIGDKFLIEVAKRLKASLRDEDTVSRLGGDEFILVFPGTNSDGAAMVASKLLEVVSKPYQIDEHELVGTPSIGIAIYPNDGDNFEDLLKNADAAMYRVKQESRNNFRFFTAEMQSHSERNLQLVNAMRHALERNEFHLLYQPQVTLSDGHIIGAEALLRWQHPELGLISPAEFIPIAEDSGQIITIGEWVLREAVTQMKAWMDSGLPPMVVAVNLSAIQFRQPNLAELVTSILSEAHLPAEYLELELTEAVAMDDPQIAVNIMDDLFARGIRMSIDDFGTGYSSLSYLKRFKVNKLKIDQSFVRDISEDPEDKAIVTAIINLASSLGMHTIAEGVETASQLAFLRLQGCDEVQGYYFSKPLPSVQFEEFVRKQK
jgi:diguanylate cyclase (GGDEF)-like protein/PAS domain S-box-containing protein